MKKVIFALVAMVGMSMTAQTSKYVSAGVSIGNNNTAEFAGSSYPSLEVGIIKHDIAYGVAVGTYSFTDNTYWVEAKVTPSFPLGYVSGNIILGIGTFTSKPEDKAGKTFHEIGFGISKTFSNNIGLGLSASRWAEVNYVTPSISYTFN